MYKLKQSQRIHVISYKIKTVTTNGCLVTFPQCDLQGREVDQIEIEAFSREQNFIGWTETSVKLDLMVEESMR